VRERGGGRESDDISGGVGGQGEEGIYNMGGRYEVNTEMIGVT